MLNLKLRDEFLGPHMPGTAISLRKSDNTGAAQQDPDQILSITYPTADVQGSLRAISSKRPGRPIVLMETGVEEKATLAKRSIRKSFRR